MRISDWSSDVCSSDLQDREAAGLPDSGGADLRSELGGPLILEAAGRVPHDGRRLTDSPTKQRPPTRAVDQVIFCFRSRSRCLIEASCRSWPNIADRKSTRLNSSH